VLPIIESPWKWPQFREKRETVAVLAHPGDETVGMSFLLQKLSRLSLVYVTDGATHDSAHARALGFESELDFAAARFHELRSALSRVRFPESRLQFLGFGNRESLFNLKNIYEQLREIFRLSRPAWVLTHAFEGDQPDCAATALAVHWACQEVNLSGGPRIQIGEFSNSHPYRDASRSLEFLENTSYPGDRIELSDHEQEIKAEMISCYRDRSAALRHLPLSYESYRVAPTYDFLKPPATSIRVSQEAWVERARRFVNDRKISPPRGTHRELVHHR
jgi:N-acetylglucosamine malate deacetylase 2